MPALHLTARRRLEPALPHGRPAGRWRRVPMRVLALPAPHRLALAALLCLGGWQAAWSQSASAPAAPASAPAEPLALEASKRLEASPEGDAAKGRPLILQADRVQLRPDIDALAEGRVEFRRAGTVIKADRLTYDSANDQAQARGSVLIERGGARYKGSELQLKVQRFEGYFLQPEFEFLTLGSGGRAERVDFIDAERSRAQRALYTSCPREGGGNPDWLLRTDRVRLDFETNEGVAEGAVLQFLGVPILGLPVMSFPLTDDRKSGWLPPTLLPLDTRNGFTLGVPYYWNIAPNRDATFTPTVFTRRGFALDTEFRYLERHHEGRVHLHVLPYDQLAGRARHAWDLDQRGVVGPGLHYGVLARQVSDDAYWKDFPQYVSSTSPRLLSQQWWLEREQATAWGPLIGYARLQHWQVLQTALDSDRIQAPYQRSPQLGLRMAPLMPPGWQASLQTEVNRFSRPDHSASDSLPNGWRWHALGSVSRPWTTPGTWVTPKLSVNAAYYRLDQASSQVQGGSRVIPTASLDAGAVFERDSTWFGRPQRQTLEPRLLWVNTPYRDQSRLPLFDAAERDFNSVSIYAENAFSGIDRVADANQITTGVTTRLVDPVTGAETLRLGLAQRVRLRNQRVVLSGDSLDNRFSDVLVEGGTSVFKPWQLDAALQYNPDSKRVVRSILGARFSPGPFRTLSVGYRLARGLSEQAELGWQWPVYRGTATPVGAASGCGGTLYAVGRLNYSLKDRRTTDSVVGMEYDSGCWIARVVAERLSTGRAEATTKLLLQLELVGLSKLGANPLQVLKDNIPGYRLLREPRSTEPFAQP